MNKVQENLLYQLSKLGDDTKTYPVVVNHNIKEMTPSQIRELLSKDVIEVTREEFESIQIRLELLENSFYNLVSLVKSLTENENA